MKIKSRYLLMAISILASAVFSAGASAHTVLINSSIEVGKTYTYLPDSITLTFADNLLNLPGKNVNSISIFDPMNEQIAKGVKVSGNQLIATLNESMKMYGDFNVTYRVVAQDGHVVSGGYLFKIGKLPESNKSSIKIIDSGIFKFKVYADGNNQFIKADKFGTASAEFSIDFSKKLFCYQVRINKLSNLTGAHIHAILNNGKVQSVKDEVFINLNANTIYKGKRGCVKSDSTSLTEIANDPNHYFLMIHTVKFPDGAIGGVLSQSK